MHTAVIDTKDSTTPGKIGYGILGFFYAVAVYQVPAFIVAAVIAYAEVADVVRASILIQLLVGIALSVIAYNNAPNSLIKSGMRVCYGLVTGLVITVGVYSILTSF